MGVRSSGLRLGGGLRSDSLSVDFGRAWAPGDREASIMKLIESRPLMPLNHRQTPKPSAALAESCPRRTVSELGGGRPKTSMTIRTRGHHREMIDFLRVLTGGHHGRLGRGGKLWLIGVFGGRQNSDPKTSSDDA